MVHLLLLPLSPSRLRLLHLFFALFYSILFYLVTVSSTRLRLHFYFLPLHLLRRTALLFYLSHVACLRALFLLFAML